MENKIKESVGTLLAHIIKIDNRDVKKEAPLFEHLASWQEKGDHLVALFF